MNWLDWIIVAALAFSAFQGAKSGLVKAAFSLGGLALGVFLALRLVSPLSPWVSGFIPQPDLTRIVSFIIVLGLVLVATSLAGTMLSRMLSAAGLGSANLLGGAAFGLLTGALSIAALIATLVRFELLALGGAVSQSWIAALLLDKTPLVLALLPPEFDKVRSFFR